MSNDTLKVGNVTLSGNFIVLDCNDDDAPEPDYEAISVPGRSGDLHLWNDRWKNKMITYHCMCRANARTAVPALLTQLLSQYGYQRITDSLHTTYYKMGEYVGATTPIYSDGGQTARFDLTFDCKPQKWLLSGETEISITSSGVSITNPTNYPAYPLLIFKGYGTVKITEYYSTAHSHHYEFNITDSGITPSTQNKEIRYDSDIFDAWEVYSGANFNQYVSSLSEKMKLTEGKTKVINESSSNLKISLIPRWWTL